MSISILDIKKRQNIKTELENSQVEEEPVEIPVSEVEDEKYEFDMVNNELDDLGNYHFLMNL